MKHTFHHGLLCVTLVFMMAFVPVAQTYAAGNYTSFQTLKEEEKPAKQGVVYKYDECPHKTENGECAQSPNAKPVFYTTYVQVIQGGIAIMEIVTKAIGSFVKNQIFKTLTSFFSGVIESFFGFLTDLFDFKSQALRQNESKRQNEKLAFEALNKTREAAIQDSLHNRPIHNSLEKDVFDATKDTGLSEQSGEMALQCKINTQYKYPSSAYATSVNTATINADKMADNAGAQEGPLENLVRRAKDCLNYSENDLNGSVSKYVEECKAKYGAAIIAKINADALQGESTDFHSKCDDGDDLSITNFITNPTYIEQEDPGCGKPNTGAEEKYKLKGFIDHYTGERATTPITEQAIKDSYNEKTGMLGQNEIEYILEKKTFDSLTSIVDNSLNHLLAKDKEPVLRSNNDGERQFLTNEIKEIIGDEGATDKKYAAYTGNENYLPSYEGQLQFLAKIQYTNPAFESTNFSKLGYEGGMLRKSATESMVLYDALQSAQRQEAIMAAILEVLLQPKQEELEELSAELSGN